MPFILTSSDDNVSACTHINAVTHTQTVTHHLNNIFHSCCGSQCPPMWLLCVDTCEECGHGNRHRCTGTEEPSHTQTHRQQISLCAMMSHRREKPAPPCRVVVSHVCTQMPTDMKYDMREVHNLCVFVHVCGPRCIRLPNGDL